MMLKFCLSLKAKSLTPTKREQDWFFAWGFIECWFIFFYHLLIWREGKTKSALKIVLRSVHWKRQNIFYSVLVIQFSQRSRSLCLNLYTYIIIHAVGAIKNQRFYQFTYQFLFKNNFYAIQTTKYDRFNVISVYWIENINILLGQYDLINSYWIVELLFMVHSVPTNFFSLPV